MTPENFCYWLKGYLELTKKEDKKIVQWQMDEIEKHLNYVFTPVIKAEDLKGVDISQLDISKFETRIC